MIKKHSKTVRSKNLVYDLQFTQLPKNLRHKPYMTDRQIQF